jgi:hypothetical protein
MLIWMYWVLILINIGDGILVKIVKPYLSVKTKDYLIHIVLNVKKISH